MEKAIRTFIAVKIIPENQLLETLFHLKRELSGEAIKWVKPESLHITLKFLGDTTQQQVEEIKTLLEKRVQYYRSIHGSLKGLNYFKIKGQPRVLFTNVYDNDQLKRFAEDIQSGAVNSGFEKETRSFKPHLTLARIKFLKNKKTFYQLVDEYKNAEFQPAHIGEIIFYQSKLKPEGPIYQPLKIFTLND